VGVELKPATFFLKPVVDVLARGELKISRQI
jgi:hypothetical protein